jgi:hypothetical protein
METMDVSKLSIKESEPRATGVSKFIREQLEQLPEGQAISQISLAELVVSNCPSVPDKRQAYVRINHVLKSLDTKFKRYKNDKDVTYIGR